MRKEVLLTLPFLAVAAVAQVSDKPLTPEEMQTDQLNRGVEQDNQNAQDRYEHQQKVYDQQQQQYANAKASYEDEAARYLAAKDRYAADRARYQRGEWPSRYERLTFLDSDQIVGAPVKTYTGESIGRAEGLARIDGRVQAVRVLLNDSTQHVWIDRADLRFDKNERLLVTDFAEHDLKTMARESY